CSVLYSMQYFAYINSQVHNKQLHSFPTRRSSDLAVKKNKDIQIRIDENKIQRNGVSIPVSELSIGNKKIGQILQLDEKKYQAFLDRKSTRLNSSHVSISYAVFCLKKKK